MLCKEQGITVIGVCCVFDIFVANHFKLQNIPTILNFFNGKSPPWIKRSFLRCSLLVGTTVSLMYARIKVMNAKLPHFTKLAFDVFSNCFQNEPINDLFLYSIKF